MNELIRKWLMWALLSPFVALAEGPAGGVQPSAIDLSLPIHQQKKLHPELFDPVLGDQAQIIEWAWSPQYAKRFGLQPQADGLPDGALWLVGVKIARQQYQQWQAYRCNIVGVMDNTLPILTPPGEIYTMIPGVPSFGGMPGVRMAEEVKSFTPAQATWYRFPKNNLEQTRPQNGITQSYVHYHRQFQKGLAYFEIEGGCAYFNDPQLFRNEIRFPTRFIHENRTAAYEPDAIRFDLPDSLMRRIYPYTLDANDWTSCLMTRVMGKKFGLSIHALQSKRFGNTCEPVTQQAK